MHSPSNLAYPAASPFSARSVTTKAANFSTIQYVNGFIDVNFKVFKRKHEHRGIKNWVFHQRRNISSSLITKFIPFLHQLRFALSGNSDSPWQTPHYEVRRIKKLFANPFEIILRI